MVQPPVLQRVATAWRGRKRHPRSTALAGALLLVTPLVVFLRFQSYSLFSLEALVSLLLFATCGALLGWLFDAFGSWARALLYAGLITLTVDIQIENPEPTRLLWIVWITSSVVLLLLRRVLPQVGPPILITMLLVSLLAPPGHNPEGIQIDPNSAPGDPDLPIVVHLLLDEHIGIEGIPHEFDPDGDRARELRDLYLDRGFRVFGRAYSRYYSTFNSIPSLLNFDAPKKTQEYSRQEGKSWVLEENRYFDTMTDRGYQIRVIQANYLDYFSEAGGNIEWCWTFDPERLNAIEGSPLDLRRKVGVILGVYACLSSVAEHLALPTQHVTPIATLPILDVIREEVADAEPGTLFFAHLMLPHSPYGLTSDCEVRPDPEEWLLGYDKALNPRRNNASTRSQRYPLYLAQIDCVMQKIADFLDELEASPHANDMVVIIHGDHGSRLDCGPPTMLYRKELTAADYVDAFSTLFVVKHPQVRAGYDRRMIPIDLLFRALIRDGAIPKGTAWVGDPEVLLKHGSTLRSMPMPEFGRDLDTHTSGDGG